MTLFEKFFFAHFLDQKLGKISKKWKILKSANKKNCQKWPKSFRNWVNPILGTKNDIFREIFFAHFLDQKNSKKFRKNQKF